MSYHPNFVGCIYSSFSAGVPVAFSLGLPIILFFIFNPEINSAFVAQRITAPVTYVLLALPAFLLSGRMMNLTSVTDRLLDLAVALVGRFKGLAYANALASMFLPPCRGLQLVMPAV